MNITKLIKLLGLGVFGWFFVRFWISYFSVSALHPALNSSLPKDKYDQVQTGMTIEEVKRITGEPGQLNVSDVTIGNKTMKITTYNWLKPHEFTSIGFSDGKVVSKSRQDK
jgi:hypothetical protein